MLVQLAYRNPEVAGTVSPAVRPIRAIRKAAGTLVALQRSDRLWICVLFGLVGGPAPSHAAAEP